MRRIKKYTAPDGLDWRDPNMPVLRYGNVNGVIGQHLIKSNIINEYYHYKMLDGNYNPPNWRNDPSYWWNRNGKRK